MMGSTSESTKRATVSRAAFSSAESRSSRRKRSVMSARGMGESSGGCRGWELVSLAGADERGPGILRGHDDSQEGGGAGHFQRARAHAALLEQQAGRFTSLAREDLPHERPLQRARDASLPGLGASFSGRGIFLPL